MKLKKILYVILGCIGVGLGALGAVLPLLPAFYVSAAGRARYVSCGRRCEKDTFRHQPQIQAGRGYHGNHESMGRKKHEGKIH